MTKRKSTHRQKLSTTTVTVRPQTPPGVNEPPRHRTLRARATGGTFMLLDGALDLGLAPGDEVRCVRGVDGIRYFASIEEPREGTLARILVSGAPFCSHHRAEIIDEMKDDLRHRGAGSVHERGGTIWSFWSAGVPTEDVAEAVARSASAYGLPNSITPDEYRPDVICRMVSFGPPQSVRAA